MGREKLVRFVAIGLLAVVALMYVWLRPAITYYQAPVVFDEAVEYDGPAEYTLHTSGVILLNLFSEEPFTVNGEPPHEEFEGVWYYYYSNFSSQPGGADFIVDGQTTVSLVSTGLEPNVSLWPKSVSSDGNHRLALTIAILALTALLAHTIHQAPTSRPKPRL